MPLPEFGSGLLVGIGFGVLGIAFWVVGIVVFDRLLKRYGPEDPPFDDDGEAG